MKYLKKLDCVVRRLRRLHGNRPVPVHDSRWRQRTRVNVSGLKPKAPTGVQAVQFFPNPKLKKQQG